MSAADELREFLTQYEPGPAKQQEALSAPPVPESRATLGRFQKLVKRLLGGHSLKWEPGSYGKAFFQSDGSLHSWPVDHNFEPNHGDHAALNGIKDWRPPYLFISPDGQASHYGAFDDDAKHRLHSVPQIDNRLTLIDPDNEW